MIEHLDVVKSIANRLARRLPQSVEIKDLISVGMLGLIDAAGRYHDCLGVPFDAYARKRVLGAMLDELRALDRAPRSLRRLERELNATLARLHHELGREPTEEEIARGMDISEVQYHRVVDQLRAAQPGSMRELEATDDRGETAVALTIGQDESPEAQLENGEMRQLLAEALERLPERERHLLTLYYREELTLKEVGQTIGVCESRASQLRSQAIDRLRVSIEERLGHDRNKGPRAKTA